MERVPDRVHTPQNAVSRDLGGVGHWSGLQTTHPEQTIGERLPSTHTRELSGSKRAKSPNIPHRWLAEETAVFAVKLAGAFVSDLKGSTCGVQTIHEHASPRCLQPKLFLIPNRTHGGEHPEMMVQRGHAHARD